MKDKLRIGFVSVSDALDVRSWSGIQFHILKYLRDQDVELEIISPLSRNFRVALFPAQVAALLTGRRVTPDHFPIALESYGRQVSTACERANCDVLLTTSSIPITRVKVNVPIVLWTDAVFQSMVEYYGGPFANLSGNAKLRGAAQESAALKRVTAAAYASRWAAEGARRLTGPDEWQKITVVPFGASMPSPFATVETARDHVRHKRERRDRACRLLFIGVDWARKGGPIVLEVVGELVRRGVSVELTIIGCELAEKLPSNVRVLGFLNKSNPGHLKQINEELLAADFLIMPSAAEAAGIVFSEASAYSVPSIALATGGVPDYVRDGQTGLLFDNAKDVPKIASRISQVLSDDAMYERLAVGAFSHYLDRLNWKQSVNSIVGICRRSVEAMRLRSANA